MIKPLFLLPLADSFWLPSSASTSSEAHDAVFDIILYTTGFFFLLVVGLMLVFVIRYRRRANAAPGSAVTHNTPLEVAWTAIPLIIVIIFFVLGFRDYMHLDQPPSNAYQIDVLAKKWSFTFNYPNGASSKDLYIPVGQPVVLNMTSQDVTHALFIPAFRLQRNVIPQRTTRLWFEATRPSPQEGFTLFCTQYCGTQHSYMGSGNPDPDQATRVYALPTAEWDAKLRELANPFMDPVTKKPLPYRVVGEKLYKTVGCAGCHVVDGKTDNGYPNWGGLYKRPEKFADGSSMPVVHPGAGVSEADLRANDQLWDDYLTQSILDPNAKIVVPYKPNIMPSYAAQLSGTPAKQERLRAIIEYIKSVGNPQDYREMPIPAAGSQPAAQPGAVAPSSNQAGNP